MVDPIANHTAGLPALWAYLSSWQGPNDGVHGPVVHRGDLKRMRATHDTPWTQHAVIEGLLELYQRSQCDYWLDRAVRLADAQCTRLEPAGHFRWAGHEDDRFSSLVHNALADCALLAVADVLKHRDDHQRRERYLNAVERNLVDYVVGELYRPSLGGFVMNPFDHYAETDRFIANMNSVAVEALIKLDMQRGTTRFVELVNRVAETLLSQQAQDGPCRGSFCYSHIERDVHIPLYTALTLRGLPALMRYTGNTRLQEVARDTLAFLDNAVDPDTGLWVHKIKPTRIRRYPIFVAGAGIICNGILDAAELVGTAVDRGDLAARLLQHQYPNGAIRNFIGYDHPDNGRPQGTGEVCWEDVYPTPNWNAQAFRFLCRVLPPPEPAPPARLRSFYLLSFRDSYFHFETSNFSLISGARPDKNFLLALYLKRMRYGLVIPVQIGALIAAAKRAKASILRGRDRPEGKRKHRSSPATEATQSADEGYAVLLATKHAFLPQRVGGSESSMHNLALAMRGRGFNVSVFAAWSPKQPGAERYRVGTMARPDSRLVCDQPFGYPVFRSKKPLYDVAGVVRSARPAVVIVNAGKPMALADRFVECGIATIVYIRDALFDRLGGTVRDHHLMRYVTTSRALATLFEKEFGFRPADIPPIVIPELYEVEPARQSLVFVCPFPQKGVEIALALAARRPDIPFTFVECWPMNPEARSALKHRVRALDNVVLRNSTHDMREIYREARIVLAPSTGFEGWGRVVSEAQVSGIPALASNIGGLPEAVGPGGLLVAPDASIDEWQRALSQMWDDRETYESLAAMAYQHARRSEFHPDALLQRLLAVIGELSALPGDEAPQHSGHLCIR
jgi:glycosyltransferase involved in cell wall biosynthesis/rhamnogalacturonyl hydrolase YesR